MTNDFLIDAHLDLALNALEWNRDLTRPIAEIRAGESGLNDKPGRGCGTVCLPEMRRGGIGLAVVTQIAKVKTSGYSPVNVWQSPSQAWAMTQAQLAWYRALEDSGDITRISSRADLDKHAACWESAPDNSWDRLPVGCIMSLEGADSLISLNHLERAYESGLRALGLAHYGPGIYAQGTNSDGGLSPRGRDLLAEMQRLGIILDVTHLTDEGFWEALKLFSGPVWASHHNCRAITPHQRQLADNQIRALIERDAVIGVAMDGWMLVPGWVRDQTTPQSAGLRLDHALNHVDHVCQLAGNALNVGLGSDLDGGFGREQSPADLDTIADLGQIPNLMLQRGARPDDVRNFAHGNFLRFLRHALPR